MPCRRCSSTLDGRSPSRNRNNVNTAGEAALQKFIGSFEFDTDTEHITNLANVAGSAQTYMAAVAPWFFTHFGPNTSLNKNVSNNQGVGRCNSF